MLSIKSINSTTLVIWLFVRPYLHKNGTKQATIAWYWKTTTVSIKTLQSTSYVCTLNQFMTVHVDSRCDVHWLMFKILISSVLELGRSCRLREGFPDWNYRSVYSLEFTLENLAVHWNTSQLPLIFSIRNRHLSLLLTS